MGWIWLGVGLIVVPALIGLVVGWAFADSNDPVDALMCAGMGAFVCGFVGFLLSIVPISYGHAHYNERTLQCKTLEKDRGGNHGGMRIYTSCGTFANEDMWFRGKTQSGDLWPKVHPGTVQTYHVVGWRLGITDDFPNVLAVK
jgi:hypothetical protein